MKWNNIVPYEIIENNYLRLSGMQ